MSTAGFILALLLIFVVGCFAVAASQLSDNLSDAAFALLTKLVFFAIACMIVLASGIVTFFFAR